MQTLLNVHIVLMFIPKMQTKQGVTSEELAEAIMVASAVRAGGSYAHMANMIQSYQD